MSIRSIKYEFLSQRKEAVETVQDWLPASLRSDLEKTLILRRPDKVSKKSIQTIQTKLK